MLKSLSSRRWHALLDRGLVTLEGADSRKLLQGLTSANMDRLEAEGQPVYTGFLNAQGRVLGAGFLLPARDGGVIVDVDAAVAAPLTKHLNRYKLRSKVKITDRSADFTVCVGGGPDAAAAPAGGALAGDGAAWTDPRLDCLGWRALLPRGAECGSLTSGSTAAPAALYGIYRLAVRMSVHTTL
jgi:folate-binding Fe-S cluster repair protein YgfZ